MVNYVIIPRWLKYLLDRHHIPLDTAINGEQLSSILSKKELYFYVYINSKRWVNLLPNRDTKRLLSALSIMGDNYVRSNFKYDDGLVSYYSGAASKNPDEITKKIDVWLAPTLLNNEILGLVTTDIQPSSGRLRRDIYHVVNKIMSSDDIIRSVLFGV